jgi:hypothetical protein
VGLKVDPLIRQKLVSNKNNHLIQGWIKQRGGHIFDIFIKAATQ